MLKVAKSISIKGLDSGLPAGTGPFDEVRRFEWNVEAFITKSQEFTYNVGEGPLYWYRIDWYPSICSNQTPASITPTISYIAPNCPYEIIENCIVLPPDCPCDIPCHPGECVSREIEVWHLMATSVNHLCNRINQECCNRKPPGFMRRVRQYLRPALCCDVSYPAPDGIDHYVDVDFIKCECGNLVDPCIKRFIYPEHINRCGIHGPAFTGPDPTPISNVMLTENIFGSPIRLLADLVNTTATDIAPIPPAKEASVDKVPHRFGPSIPEVIYNIHNFSKLSVFKDFLVRNKDVKFDNMKLVYNYEYKSWHGSCNFVDGNEEWKLRVEFSNSQAEIVGQGFKFNLFVDRKINNKTFKSRLLLAAKGNLLDSKGNFGFSFDFNTKNDNISKGMTLQSKVKSDEIGIFKDGIILQIKMKG